MRQRAEQEGEEVKSREEAACQRSRPAGGETGLGSGSLGSQLLPNAELQLLLQALSLILVSSLNEGESLEGLLQTLIQGTQQEPQAVSSPLKHLTCLKSF